MVAEPRGERLKEQEPIRTSYVLTTRNRAVFLQRALENAREFMTPRDELIVIDAASTDSTGAVVEENRDLVSVFLSERDSGEAEGLNKGMLLARGEFIKFLTDDDYFYPDAMRLAMGTLEAHPDVDVLLCGGEAFNSDPASGKLRLVRYQYLPEGRSLRDDPYTVWRHVTCGIGLILRRRVLPRLGLLDTTFHAVDLDYLARLVTSGVEFRYLDVKLWRHVNYPHSGENDAERCGWDEIRVVLRHRSWSQLLTYPSSEIEKLVGLDELPYGSPLLAWVKEGDWLRQKMPWALRFFLLLVRAYHRCFQWAGKIQRAVRPSMRSKEAPASRARANEEPIWSNQLR